MKPSRENVENADNVERIERKVFGSKRSTFICDMDIANHGRGITRTPLAYCDKIE